MPSLLGEFHSLGESWACNGKTSKKSINFCAWWPGSASFIKAIPVFYNFRHAKRWGLGSSVNTVGVHATLWPNVPPVADKVGVGPVNHTEHFARTHVLTHSAYTVSAHINTVVHISISCLRLPWLCLWVQYVSRLHCDIWIFNNCWTKWKTKWNLLQQGFSSILLCQ